MDKMSYIVLTTMPEEGEFADFLNEVDDPEFDKKLTKSKSNRLKSLLNLLQQKVPTKKEAEQLLKLCTDDDRNCLAYEVAVISALLKNTQLIETLDTDILVSSALFLLDLLKNVVSATTTFRTMTIQTILSYPDTVHIKIVLLHGTKLLKTFDVNCRSTLSDEHKMEICHLLKMLTTLPLLEAKAFVKRGLSTWLHHIIPMTMSYMSLNNLENSANKLVYVKYLELLTDVLVTTDYFENVHWKNLIESICNVKKYPSIIKSLLDNNSDIWHRLWIVIIKLLNNYITKNIGGFGTPINSMLPVVESAFKMDAAQRIRAFECWNKLIDNFSKETNENCIAKRMKLLIIPLKLNNAKTEDIALAKFDTWWHLIRSFEYKSERFCNDVFMPFLHFVFGKSGTQKPGIPATQLSNRLKRKSLEAFVEIVGHTDCECSVDVPKLKNKILNMKLLVNNWNDWMFCLSNAFKNAGNPAVYEVSTKNYLKCTWKTMVQLVAELPDNAVRRDIFTEMLSCILNMLKDPQSTDQLRDVIVTAIMSSLFDGSAKMQELLKTKTDKYKPLFMITSAFTNASMINYYARFTEEQLINLFKPITRLVLEDAVEKENCLFDCLLPNDISLKFWTATLDNLSELNKEISSEMLSDLMEWPLKSLESFKEVKIPGIKWYSIYNMNHKKLNCTGFNKEVSRYIIPNLELVNYFTVCVTIGVLKQRLLNKESPGSMPKLLEKFTSSIKDYEEFKEIIPLIVDTLVVMLNNVAEKTDIELAKIAITSAKNLLRVIIPAFEKNLNDNKTTDNLLVLWTNLKKATNPLVLEEAYNDSILELIEELSFQLPKITKESPLFNSIVNHMKMVMSLTSNKVLKVKINKVLEPKQETKINKQNKIIINEPVRVFTTPDVKKVKKIKKNEFNIVNKVVENGEEYVVVKCNWKFNPKKLTENQKEKFQRKREDIPALYQDLSQSQDEIKLTTWKTDSQDSSTTTGTSTTNSKSIESGPNNQTITILKNLPNTDVVPKIMENILQESDKKIEKLHVNHTETVKEKKKRNGSLTSTHKAAKSPRMALKDRVFRNMKNLLEKSTPPKDKTEIDPDHTENIPKTPPSRPKTDMNGANSAPPMLAADRPSRMKRRPKKFDDTELFALKKRRHSQNEFSQSDIHNDDQNDLPRTQIDKSESIVDTKDVLLEESDQKTVENDSNKNTEQELVKDCNNAESSPTVDIEMKNVNNDGPIKISEIANPEVVNKVIIDSSNVNDIDPSIRMPVKDPVKDPVIETIVISESEAFAEPKEVPDGVVHIDAEPETQPECNVLQLKTVPETVVKLPATPTHTILVTSGPKSSTKKSAKKSRIEKELAIDMVEGHPFLKLQSEQRLTRKKLIETELTSKRKSVVEKINKSKSEATPKSTKKTREKKTSPNTQTSITVHETQEASQSPQNVFIDEAVCSEDVIESSQDSTITTISAMSTKKTTKRRPIVAIEKMNIDIVNETQNLLQDSDVTLGPNKTIGEEKDDTLIPQNKTVKADRSQSQLTENMDTEPISDKDIADDVIIINDNEETPILVNSKPVIGPESQEIAEADTQPNNSVDFIDLENKKALTPIEIDSDKIQDVTKDKDQTISEITEIAEAETQPNNSVDFIEFENKEATIPIKIDQDKIQDVTKDQTIPEITITENRLLQADSITEAEKENDLSSPFNDNDQRKKDFLNNTLEISPIKIQSPDREKKSPSPETSSDYVVIKLSSPVHSNGEPFQKHGSPEFFTNDKISPDKRDISPPRAEIITVNNTSPSSSLSLKKNKPQVRSGGRAAHMLGLCVPDKLNTIKMADRSEPEELKKASTPARKNLRVLYNTVADNSESTDNEESESFLKLKRSLPSVDSSPAGPILKRKLSDITDETTTSPASKRKRVSFHDPPVSTTISVLKYIEPIGLRSPQNSAQKRLERQTRQSQYSKSPKRLENVFKLETVLSKAIESFAESDQPTPLTNTTPEDTQTSLEVTPAMEIVKTSDLNDTDPIFLKLVNCNDSITVIAAELSSPSLKDLFVKQIEDKVKTVGDLAKMTEVDVCRLCIKAPKVKVVKKVLNDYAAKIEKFIPTVELIEEIEMIEANPEVEADTIVINTSSIEIQTDEVSKSDIEVQTIVEPVATGSTQTNALSVSHIDVQTDESGSKTTADVIATCLNEREDFIEKLSEMLEESSIRKVAEKLPTNIVFDVLMDKQSTTGILDEVLARESLEASGDRRNVQKCMSFITDFMSQRFQSKDLILFCSQLLQKVHDRSS